MGARLDNDDERREEDPRFHLILEALQDVRAHLSGTDGAPPYPRLVEITLHVASQVTELLHTVEDLRLEWYGNPDKGERGGRWHIYGENGKHLGLLREVEEVKKERGFKEKAWLAAIAAGGAGGIKVLEWLLTLAG